MNSKLGQYLVHFIESKCLSTYRPAQLTLGVMFLLLCSCSQTPSKPPPPQDPEWITGPARIVEGGYIVYVGTAEDSSLEKAKLKAQGQALEDLANECSLIPKGTRVEDRFSKQPNYLHQSFVKIGVEFQLCEKAKNANSPDSIRQIANATFTEELKKYQDFMETGELSSAKNEVQPPEEWMQEADSASAGASGFRDSTTTSARVENVQVQYFVTRQTIVYQKQIVVLSPPQYFAPGSPETAGFTRNLQTQNQNLTQIIAQNPSLPKSPTPWSRIPDKPVLQRPINLTPGYRPHPTPIRPMQPAQNNPFPHSPAPPTVNNVVPGNKKNPKTWPRLHNPPQTQASPPVTVKKRKKNQH